MRSAATEVYIPVHRHRKFVDSIPAGGPNIVDELFSAVAGSNFYVCIFPFEINKTHLLFRNYPTWSEMPQSDNKELMRNNVAPTTRKCLIKRRC